MRRNIAWILYLLLIMGMLSCQRLSGGTAYEMGDDTNSLAWWFPEKDSINHHYVMVAERVWKFERDCDSANVYDVDSLLAWHQECQQLLVTCYDSISPNSQWTDAIKADSMLYQLERFFNENIKDSTSIGRIVVEDLLNSFNRYRCVALSHEILQHNKAFKAEMLVWENLQETMRAFCSHVTEFQRNSDMPLSVVLMTGEIYQARINDLKRLLLLSKGEECHDDYQMIDADIEVERYMHTIDEVVNIVNISKIERDDEKQLNHLYDDVLQSQQSLKDAMHQWIETREKVPLLYSDQADAMKNNTKILIVQLSEILRNFGLVGNYFAVNG